MKPGDIVRIKSREGREGYVLKVASDGSPLALVRWAKDDSFRETIFTFKELEVVP